MSDDPRFRGRIVRLATVSSIALGAIWGLESHTLDAHRLIGHSLLAGWVAMPTVLVGSLRWPPVRTLVIVPSTLVTLGLLGACLSALPAAVVARIGWLMITSGILLGDVLGAWFWYRWLPVPASFDDPFSSHRWSLVAVHIGLILGGLVLVPLSWVL